MSDNYLDSSIAQVNFAVYNQQGYNMHNVDWSYSRTESFKKPADKR